ncbi:MAG: MOSC domain-containing protein [Chloroflexi bacterium]|nr:MOSC domain-containing protein [Chloroflexota bacterium]
MFEGTVDSIHIAPVASEPTVSVEQAHAVPGKGLEGDRYFKREGTYSDRHGPDREVTLIEIETIEALERDYKYELSPGDARRNIVTRDVPLNHLVGREFQVGEVTLRGIRLNEPCNHLAGLTDDKVKQGLVHRGGLRAQILTEGTIQPGDEIRPR